MGKSGRLDYSFVMYMPGVTTYLVPLSVYVFVPFLALVIMKYCFSNSG